MGSGFRCLHLCGGMYTGGWTVVLGVSGSEIWCPLTKLVLTSSGLNTLKTGLEWCNPQILHENKL